MRRKHARPAGPQLEARRADSGSGFFWEGHWGLGSGKGAASQRTPSTPPMWSDGLCKLPQLGA